MDTLWMSLAWFGGLSLVIVGLIGTLLPVVPGPPLVLFGLWLIALADDYQHVGGAMLIVIGLIALLSLALDFMASVLGAKRVGASKQALSGAFIGSVLGAFLGIPGLMFGPFVGALIGEWIAQRQAGRAVWVGVATWIGLILGSLAKLALTLTMILLFVVAYII